MAVTDRAAYRQNSNNVKNTGNDGLRGVSDATKAQQAKYANGYQQSQSVTDAQNKLKAIEAAKPGAYTSKYAAPLADILNQITNGEKFSYNFNDDEIFKYYADLYTEKGRQASADTMAQAQAMTGGYGNSYAQSVGNQAYQQYLLSLYDKGMDLQQQAYQRFADDRADKYNQYNALQAADATDYGRYRDTVTDWQTDRSYYSAAEQDAYNRDYSQWNSDRDYWNTMAQNENADYWANENMIEGQYQFDADLEEKIRQYNLQLAEEQRQFDEKLAAEYAAALGIGGDESGSSSGRGNGGGKDKVRPGGTYVPTTPTENSGLSFKEQQMIKNADKVAQAATGYSTMDEALAAEAANNKPILGSGGLDLNTFVANNADKTNAILNAAKNNKKKSSSTTTVRKGNTSNYTK